MPLRALTPEEIAAARNEGYEVPAGASVDDATGDIKLPEVPTSGLANAANTLSRDNVAGVSDLAGLGLRQFGLAAAPTAIGGIAWNRTVPIAEKLAGAIPNPIAKAVARIGIPLVSSAIAAHVGARGQDAILNRVAPDLMGKAAQDVQQHPWLSAAAGLPASRFAGGSLLPSMAALKTPRDAAKMALIQGGMSTGTQLATTGTIDPTQTAIATLGGPFFAGRSSAVPESTLKERIKTLQGQPAELPVEAKPQAERLDFNAINILSPEQLNTIAGKNPTADANFFREAARIKKAGVTTTPDMLKQLAVEGQKNGHDKAAAGILATELPKIKAQADKQADILAEAKAANPPVIPGKDIAEVITPNEQPSAQTLDIKKQAEEAKIAAYKKRLATTQQGIPIGEAKKPVSPVFTDTGELPAAGITEIRKTPPVLDEAGIANPQISINRPSSTGAAAQSAKTILGKQPTSPADAINVFRNAEKDISKLDAQASEYPEGHPIREQLVRIAADMRSKAEADLARSLSGAKAPEIPAGVGSEEVARPREREIIEEPTKETPPSEEEGLLPPEEPITPKPTAPIAPVEPAPLGSPESQARGVAPTPTQKSKEFPKQTRLESSIQEGDNEGLRARNLIAKMPGYETFKTQHLDIDDPADRAQMFYEKLSAQDKTKLNKLFDMGATDIPKVAAPMASPIVKGATKTTAVPVEKLSVPGKIKTQETAKPFRYMSPVERMQDLAAEWKQEGYNVPFTDKDWPTIQQKLDAVFDKNKSVTVYYDALPFSKEQLSFLHRAGVIDAQLRTPPFQVTRLYKTPIKGKGLKTKEAQQKAEQKGGQSGSVLNPFPALEKLNPIEWMREKTRGIEERLAPLGALGKHFSRNLEAAYYWRDANEQPKQEILQRIGRDLSMDEQLQVSKYLYDQEETAGQSKIKLSSKLQEAADAVNDAIIKPTGAEKAAPDAPLVYDYDKQGKPISRRFEMQPFYVPHGRLHEASEIIAKPTKDQATYNEIEKAYVRHFMDKLGVNKEEALKLFANTKNPTVGPTAPNPEFRGMRYSSGIGMPKLVEEPNIFKVLPRYLHEHYSDLAWHKHLESDPAIAKGLNLPDNGRGEAIPEIAKLPTGEEVGWGDLNHDDVKAALRDYVGGLDPTAQAFEKYQALIHVGRIGPLSQARNILQNLGTLTEVLRPDELTHIYTGVKDMFTSAGRDTALKAGSVRSSRNVMPTVAQDLNEGVTKLTDVISRYSGAELLSKANDVMLDSIGRAVAKHRIEIGDAKFFDTWGPPKWRTIENPAEVINFVAAKFTKNFAGAYNAMDLPPSLLRGSNAQFAPLFKLARWSVGRFNRWYENVYTPAKKGNLYPMLSTLAGGMLSAGAINFLVEQLTNRKPKELTWDEYLKLGGQDTAYTLFSKAATASYGGLLSDIAFGAVQMANKEVPRSYNNLAFQTVSDTITRLSQFGNAFAAGDVGLDALPRLAMELGRDQLQIAKLLTPVEDTGKREERIAARLGYIPQGTSMVNPSLPNPFSEAGAYRDENTGLLRNIMKRKMSSGIMPEAPASDVRTSMRLKDGKVENYYNFIKTAQGEEASKAALTRDIDSTMKKRRLYSSALTR